MKDESFLMILMTVIIGIVLTVLPLPYWVSVFRPAFLVLIVLYWSTMAPHAGGIALAFFSGLLLDVFQGSVLGEHALALSLVAYLGIRLHLLVRPQLWLRDLQRHQIFLQDL